MRSLVPRRVGVGASKARTPITRLLVSLLLAVPVALALGSVAQGVSRASTCGSDGGNFGTELLGSAWPGRFTGVPVYSNGPSSSYDNGCENKATTPNGVTVPTGTEWQCVELVNRLYVTKGWINTTWYGDGDTMWNRAPDGLKGVRQGSISYLAPGDVVSIDAQPPPVDGVQQPEEPHVLIVSAVNGSMLTFVSQNAGTTTARVTTSGTLSGGTLTMATRGGWNYPVKGVVHAPVPVHVPAWIPTPVPTPAQATGDNVLRSVSCPTTVFCMAVGQWGTPDGHYHPLAEVWRGTGWSILSMPGQSGSDATYVNGVSCVSATWYVAVGQSASSTSSWGVSYATEWNGTDWLPLSAIGGDRLESVSCISRVWCMAVGFAESDTYGAGLVTAWNGTAWSVAAEPGRVNLSTAPGSEFPQLMTVSCTSATWCVTTSGAGKAEVLVGAGRKWTRMSDSSSPPFGVSCVSQTFCMGVTPPNATEEWDGKNWKPLPAATSGGPTGLGALSCVSPLWCMGVSQSNIGIALLKEWNGSDWTLMPTNEPTDFYATFFGISCASPLFCAAVGGGGRDRTVIVAEVYR